MTPDTLADDADRLIRGRGTSEHAWLSLPALMTLPSMTEREIAAWAHHRHIWIVSPHPDDEILGLAGLMAALGAHGAAMTVVSVTDGTGSHPASFRYPPERLGPVRSSELRRALNAMGVVATIVRAGLPDGSVSSHRANLTAFLSSYVTEGDLVFVTWRLDGHPDHEAAAQAARRSACDAGATLIEYPVWMWHWAERDEPRIPWMRARRVELSPNVRDRKRDAIGQFVSQTTADGNREAILPPHVVDRFTRPFEVVFC